MAAVWSSRCPVALPVAKPFGKRMPLCCCRAPSSTQQASFTSLVQLDGPDSESREADDDQHRQLTGSGASNNVVVLSRSQGSGLSLASRSNNTSSSSGSSSTSSSSSRGNISSSHTGRGSSSVGSSNVLVAHPLLARDSTAVQPAELVLMQERHSTELRPERVRQHTQPELESFNMPAPMVARLLAAEKRSKALERRAKEAEVRAAEAEAALFEALQRERAVKATSKQLETELGRFSNAKAEIELMQQQVQCAEDQLCKQQTDHQAVIFDYNRQVEAATARKQHDAVVIRNLLSKLARAETALFAVLQQQTQQAQQQQLENK